MAYEDKSAQAVCTFAYCEGPGHEVLIFEGRVNVSCESLGICASIGVGLADCVVVGDDSAAEGFYYFWYVYKLFCKLFLWTEDEEGEKRATDLDQQAGILSSRLMARHTPRWIKRRRTRFPIVRLR